MSLESVRAFFAAKAPDIEVIVTEASSATVALAAQAHGVEPDQIAKTICLRVGDTAMLVVAAGSARLDNRKFKDRFGGKARMLEAEEVVALSSLTRVVGSLPPVGTSLGSPVPSELSRIRLGQGVEVALHALPLVDAFAPLWALALPGAGAVVSLDSEVSPMLRAVAAALHVQTVFAREIMPAFAEDDPTKDAHLVRLVIERAAS